MLVLGSVTIIAVSLLFSFCCFYVCSCGDPSPGLRAPSGAQGDLPWSKPYASTDLKKKEKKVVGGGERQLVR